MAGKIAIKPGHKDVKLYVGRPGKSEAEIVAFCKDVVVPWLKDGRNHANGTPVNLADFWTVRGGGVLTVVAAVDNDSTDWSGIPNVSQLFEVNYPGGNLLQIDLLPTVKIP